MELSCINPYIRRGIHSTLLSPFLIRQRVILDYELLYVESGCFRLQYDGVDYLCHSEDWLLLRPGVPHLFESRGEDVEQPHIHFDLCCQPDSAAVFICFRDRPELTPGEVALLREDAFAAFPRQPRLRVADPVRFRQRFLAVIDHPEGGQSLSRRAAMLELIEQLVSDNFPGAFTEVPADTDVCACIRAYIDANYAQPMQLADLERQFGYSRFYLERRFRETCGMSVMQYRNEKRLQAARQLLVSHTVSDTAQQLSFSSIYAFSRAFRQRFGGSPSRMKAISPDDKTDVTTI